MADENMKELYLQGLQALHTAGERGSAAAAAILQAASAPELKTELEDGSRIAARQAEQLRRLFAGLDEQPGGGGRPNEIVDGIEAAGKRIRETAKDDATRDAGIIAQGQIALHYHIAAYGTLAAYAKVLGRNDDAATLKGMVEETKAKDQKYTELAERLINPRAEGSA